MQQFGPICIQRLPFEPAARLATQAADAQQPAGARFRQEPATRPVASFAASSTNWPARMQIASGLMPSASFAYLRPLFKRLGEREQSEDCLNLNVYAPVEGE